MTPEVHAIKRVRSTSARLSFTGAAGDRCVGGGSESYGYPARDGVLPRTDVIIY